MKKDYKQIPEYGNPPITGYKNIPIFVTTDGKEFTDEKRACEHEASCIKWKDFCDKYRHSKRKIDGIEYDVIFISDLSKENKLEIHKYFNNTYLSDFKLGINLILTDDSGDYTSQTIHHSDIMKTSLLTQISDIEMIEDAYLK